MNLPSHRLRVKIIAISHFQFLPASSIETYDDCKYYLFCEKGSTCSSSLYVIIKSLFFTFESNGSESDSPPRSSKVADIAGSNLDAGGLSALRFSSHALSSMPSCSLTRSEEEFSFTFLCLLLIVLELEQELDS